MSGRESAEPLSSLLCVSVVCCLVPDVLLPSVLQRGDYMDLRLFSTPGLCRPPKSHLMLVPPVQM